MGKHNGIRNPTHASARFQADLETMIEGHSILHRAPAEVWQDGLYLGNGDIAAMVYGDPQRTLILLNKGDVWDERSDELPRLEHYFDWNAARNAAITGLETGDWSAYRQATVPRVPMPGGGNFASFQPAGYLEILGELPEGFTDFQQRLSVYRAKVVSRFKYAGRESGFDAYTHASHNFLVLNIRSQAPDAWPHGFRLHRTLEPSPRRQRDPAMKEPAFGSDGDTIWMTMVFPDGFTYAVVLQTLGLVLDVEQTAESITGHVPAPRQGDLECRLTIVTGVDGTPEELVMQGRARLQKALSEEGLLESHERWWAEFWRKGWISLPDKMVENLWYTEMYKIASCSREGGAAPGQLGHWSGYPDPPWRGDYHTNINIQQNYWPIYTANRVELGSPFYDLYLGMLDFIIEETHRVCGMPGARYPKGHGMSGQDNLPGGLKYAIWPASGAWLCAHFWWHYQFTRDEDFLRKCYPMFRASLDFYLAFVGEPDASGQYNVVPSMSHEQGHDEATEPEGRLWGRNSSYDLGLLREHLRNTIRASEVLGVDETERDGWRNVLEKLAPYPVSEGGYLMEWEGIELANSHRHFSPLYPIYPGEEIHQDSSPELVRIGRRSLERFVERGFDGFCGFSFCWLACVAARMGEGDTALDLIRNHIRGYVNLNGFSMLGDAKVPGLGNFFGVKAPLYQGHKLLNMESGSSLAAAINELLLRSPSGNPGCEPTIRAFPAVPGSWMDVRFSRLRAQGAFLVTSEMRSGRICYVLLESEAGAECHLGDPWPGEEVVVRSSGGQDVSHRVDVRGITFPTHAGESYLVYPVDTDPDDLDMVQLAPDAEDSCRLGIGGPANVWPDGRS